MTVQGKPAVITSSANTEKPAKLFFYQITKKSILNRIVRTTHFTI